MHIKSKMGGNGRLRFNFFTCYTFKMYEVWKWKWSHSVVSDSLRPRGLYPTRLLCPWDSPGKNTGVGCHCLLQEIFLTQRSNEVLLHCWFFYYLSYQRSPHEFTHTHTHKWNKLLRIYHYFLCKSPQKWDFILLRIVWI